MGLFFLAMFWTYAYSFYMGVVWIYQEIDNTIFDRNYTAGDILSCFFGILFGFFSLGMASPNIKAVSEGKSAGKMAFDIIDRDPNIKLNDQNAK